EPGRVVARVAVVEARLVVALVATEPVALGDAGGVGRASVRLVLLVAQDRAGPVDLERRGPEAVLKLVPDLGRGVSDLSARVARLGLDDRDALAAVGDVERLPF